MDYTLVHDLLGDHELKVLLDAPEGDYRVEYYTSAVKDSRSDAAHLVRAYRLLDRIRGSVTQEPWDRFDLDRQTVLVAHLIEYGGYRIARTVTGWNARCPECGHTVQGKIWMAIPANCAGKGPPKCKHRYVNEDITENVRTLE